VPETVPPSQEPDSATATGTGGEHDAAAPPADSASTSGLGPQSEQRAPGGSAAPPAESPSDVSGSGTAVTEPQSPSGT
jgi:hypothetical protein